MSTLLSSISPVYGPVSGGTQVTLTGSWNAAHTFSVSFGGVAATNVTVVSSMSITCVTNAGSSVGPVTVLLTDTNDSTNSSLTKGFAYIEPGQMCLYQIRTAARQRADMVNSQFVTDAEFNSYINQSLYELYDLLITAYGNDYYIAPALTFSTDGINYLYALPNGSNYSNAPALYKLIGVDLQLGNSQDSWVTIKPFKFSDRNRYAVPNFQSFYGITNLRYRLNGINLLFTPIPAAGQSIRIWYIPRMTELVNDTDVADGVSGWIEYIIVDAAIKALQKEESDVSVLLAQKQALGARINTAGENRDAGMPQRVGDTSYLDYGEPTGSGSGFGYGDGSY